jgi:hypothetical protein
LRGEFASALEKLVEHESRLGVSLWSMSLQVALRQKTGGLSEQKAYVGNIKKLFRGGIFPFLANFFSQRAEGDVTIGWYLDNTSRRIGRSRVNDVMRYVSFKALSRWPDQAAQFATILRIEQNHHEIDIFETTISALQHLVAKFPKAVPIAAMRSVIERISHLSDCRIKKLVLAITVNQANASHSYGSDDAGLTSLVSGHLVEAYRLARAAQRSRGSALGSAVAGLASSERPSRAMNRKPRPEKNVMAWVAEGLAEIFSKRTSDEGISSNTEEAVRKFAFVFESLEFPRAIRHLIESQLGRGYRPFCESLRLSAFNSDELTPLDVIGASHDEEAARILLDRLVPGVAKRFAQKFVDPDEERTIEVSAEIGSLARTCGLLARGRVDSVSDAVSLALNSKSRAIASNAAVFALDAFAVTADIDKASALLSREVAVNDTDPEFLPIKPIFSNCEWREMKAVAEQIDLSIALFLYAQSGGDRKTHTYRCFALQTFLDSHGCETPSELRAKIGDFDPDKLLFFLWRVCEPSVLDMLPALESSRAVLEERRDICALLLQLQPGDPAFEAELLSRSSELTIRRGLQALDGSRVHVDAAALTSTLVRDLGESYQRYGALLRSGPTVSETFDAVIRELLKREINPKYLLAIPESEADELLVAMFMQVRNKFLFDPHHGLDSYLSKRIRHGSIVGYIRSPAEKEGVVTQQNPDGTYRPHVKWLKQFESSFRRADLERAFVAFAKALDQHLLRLKDVLLHVRSDKKPLGVFDVHLTPQMFHVIRSVAASDPPVEGFVKAVLAFFDAGLNPSLQSARSLLEKDTSKAISEQFDSLKASVTAIMAPTPDRAELLAAISRASANVHAAIATVATWFEPITPENVDYSMGEVVEIAIASVQATVPGFAPNVHLTDHTGAKFRNLLLLLDALFVIFGNIAHWSNVGGAPDVWFEASMDGDVLAIKVANEVALDAPLYQCQANVAERLAQVRSGEGEDMAYREGGSGFFKLAGSAVDTTPMNLDCGYSAVDRFNLSIRLLAD